MVESHFPFDLKRPNYPPVDKNITLIQAQSLRRVFYQGGQEITAVAEATCVVGAGQRIAITGPSGSGKSTLLHLFAGLDQPSGGTISWPSLGNINDLRPTNIGIALQIPGLLPPLTVAENVAIPLLITGVDPETAARSAHQTLEMLELDTLAEQLPESLSGGQAQRVALARTLVTHPHLILADEPTGQLDHPTAQRLFNLLFLAIGDHETAIVIATHDQAVAERFDQTWHMQFGTLKGDLDA